MNSFLDLFNTMESDYASLTAIRWLEDDCETISARSFAEVCTDTRRCLSFLNEKLGSAPQVHVAILAHSSYDYVVHAFALFLRGSVLVPINFEKSPEEVAGELKRADVTVLIHDGSYCEREGDLSSVFAGRILNIGDYRSSAPLEGALSPVDVNAPTMIIYTSGTTGLSKGVVHSQSTILSSLQQDIIDRTRLQAFVGKRPEDHVSELVVAPMYHVCGYDRIFGRFIHGDTVEFCTSPMLFSQCLLQLQGEYLMAFPVFYDTLYKYVRTNKLEKLGSLKILGSCGAPIHADAVRVLAANGFAFSQGLGLTETFGGGTRNMSCDISLLHSVGKVQRNFEYRILDDGELMFRGGSVMLGYYNDPEATAEVMDADGWFRTGDLAREDENGQIFLTGRSKNLIILSSGENINPEELESLLVRCEAIEEVLVKEKDKKLCAVVYCAADQQGSVEQFITEMNRNLPRYKQVNLVEFSSEPLPRTSTGKIKRN